MSSTPIRILIASSAAALLALAVATGAAAQSEEQRFRAHAVITNAVPGEQASMVDFTITRWSTDEERQALIKTFHQNGAAALLDALEDTPSVGSLRTPDSTAWDLHYASQTPVEGGGRRIILATDRPIGFWELYNNDRSADYPFMLIEIRLNERGEGEGRMSVATRIELSPDGKQLQLENYSSQPVLLRNIRRVED